MSRFMIRNILKLDWLLIMGLFLLALASLLSLASSDMDFFWRQLVWYSLAFILIIPGAFLNWRLLVSYSWFRYGLYWLSVIFLIIANFQDYVIRGTKSWLVIGSFQFEPSELMKVALILVLAGFFSRRYIEAWTNRNLFISFAYVAIPTILVAVQPDFGSAAVLLGIWLGFLLISGINKKRLIIGLVMAVIISIILWSFFLQSYQKNRLIGFLFPQYDPLGINYNVIQSKIAIGSGGFWGKGFGLGTQTQLLFLPETQTDFIFAAFTEEWGFLGAMIVIAAFLLIIFRLVNIGLWTRDNYSKFIVLGVILVFNLHFLFNIGSNLGILPVTGITFPFFSYGGSSLLTLAILLSIIQNIKLESSS